MWTKSWRNFARRLKTRQSINPLWWSFGQMSRRFPVERRKPRSLIGSEEHYSQEEFEFIKAMEGWMQRNRVKFPSFTQVLAVAKSLGYRKPVELKMVRDSDTVVIEIPVDKDCPKSQALLHAFTN